MSRPDIRPWQPEPVPEHEPDLAALLALVARGDHRAFELVYGELAGPVYGVVRQVLRDPAQSEEVAQEVAARGLALGVPVRPGPGQRRRLGADYRAPPRGRPGPFGDSLLAPGAEGGTGPAPRR